MNSFSNFAGWISNFTQGRGRVMSLSHLELERLNVETAFVGFAGCVPGKPDTAKFTATIKECRLLTIKA